jgi:hypothetical protein
VTITYDTTIIAQPEYFDNFSQSIEGEEVIQDRLLTNSIGSVFSSKSFIQNGNVLRGFKLVHNALTNNEVNNLYYHYEFNKQRTFLVYIKSVGDYVRCIYAAPPAININITDLRRAEVELLEVVE